MLKILIHLLLTEILKPEGAKMASDKTGSFSFVNLIPDKTEECEL